MAKHPIFAGNRGLMRWELSENAF